MRRWGFAVRALRCLVLLAIAARVWAPRDARALWVESLVMPGEVAAKHARVERECKKCHAPFDKAAQDALCLDCHKDVAADLVSVADTTGKDAAVRDRMCKTCHTEHQGRAADLVRFDRATFEHRLTDRPLQGGHLHVRCEDCHVAGKRYREAPGRCSECHARKDPHEGEPGCGLRLLPCGNRLEVGPIRP
jgi:predicted CXXCH cytochrome family protein